MPLLREASGFWGIRYVTTSPLDTAFNGQQRAAWRMSSKQAEALDVMHCIGRLFHSQVKIERLKQKYEVSVLKKMH